MIASDFVVLDHCASWFNLTAECLAGTNAALLRPEVTDALADSDVILHAGDINKESILDNLRNIAPVYVVRGNNDKEWAEGLPLSKVIELEGRKLRAATFYPADHTGCCSSGS